MKVTLKDLSVQRVKLEVEEGLEVKWTFSGETLKVKVRKRREKSSEANLVQPELEEKTAVKTNDVETVEDDKVNSEDNTKAETTEEISEETAAETSVENYVVERNDEADSEVETAIEAEVETTGKDESSVVEAMTERQKKATKKGGHPKVFNTPERLATMLRMYEEGITLKKIANHFGCSSVSVSRELKRQKYPSRNPVIKNKYQEDTETLEPQKVHAERTSTEHEEAPEKAETSSGIFKKPSKKSKAQEEMSKRWISSLKILERTLSESEKEEIVRLYRVEGMSMKVIAYKHNTTKRIIKLFLESKGIKIRDERHDVMCRAEHLKEEEKKVLRDAISNGLTDNEIKELVAVTDEQLRYYRRQHQEKLYGKPVSA